MRASYLSLAATIVCRNVAIQGVVDAFFLLPPGRRVQAPNMMRLQTSSSASETTTTTTSNQSTTKTKQLGLLTFDLDDTLYPISTVLDEANDCFVKVMNKFGFEGIQPNDIVETGKKIRSEIALTDPEAAAVLTHTEIRELAIRREMEDRMLEQKLKLQNCADEEWASDVVVENAKQWAKAAVSDSVVEAVLNAWEMERHHAAERHLYPEVLDVFRQIKQEHPDVIIGAVTDGKANPLFMMFTLAPYFDFCMSWEDDQGGRRNFFKELGSVEGNAELTWIYDAALEKYKKLASAAAGLKKEDNDDNTDNNDILNIDDRVWIHVGDDLAYDVGGSAACGAKTILVELADRYKQTARHRFSGGPQPAWSTSMMNELEQRRVMNEAAMEHVDAKIAFLSRIPDAINDILEKA